MAVYRMLDFDMDLSINGSEQAHFLSRKKHAEAIVAQLLRLLRLK